ncbi:MAG: DUF305 domain-containing protein [Acidimicrobiia bacterium]
MTIAAEKPLSGSGPVDPGAPDDEPGDDEPGDDGGRDRTTGRGLWIALLVAALVLGSAVGWRIGRAQGDPTVPGHGSVDVGFFQDMSTHHNQAISMAFTYLAHGTDPLLRQIAGEIVTYQSSEIGMMGEYLTTWHQAGTEDGTAMGWMGMRVPRADMPGLATKSQLATLAAARGDALDQEFTRLMIDHHAGGIHMADYAGPHAITAAVKRWAASMADGQRGEISEMNRWRVSHGMAAVPVHLS